MLPNSDIVRAMVRRGGGCDAKEFIQSLDRRFQARYQRYLEYLRDGVSINRALHLAGLGWWESRDGH